jgi:hypothetical protein
LTPVVRQALGSETIEVTSWEVRHVHGGFGFGSAGASAIHRVSGQGRDAAATLEWTLILKVLYPPAEASKPSDWDYWRREAHAYESGLLDDLPGGLQAPRCFGVADQPNGDCWIWLEDVADRSGSVDDIGEKWPLEHYAVVARHLGRFNGAYLTGQRPVPSHPWLRGRDHFRAALGEAGPLLERLREAQDHPLVRRRFPPDVVELLERRWADQAEHLDVIDQLPGTLCHGDAFRRNLFARRTIDGDCLTIAIDWAVLGIGWVGWDIKNLVSNPMVLRNSDSRTARERDRVVFAGYLDGLRDVGWQGDPRQARLGQVVRISTPTPAAIYLELCVDESQHAWIEESFGGAMADLCDIAAERERHPPEDDWLGWGEEARELLAEL